MNQIKDPQKLAEATLQNDFELVHREGEDFVQQLANKIAYMLDNQPDLLFSYFYRLDIDERQIEQILTNPGVIPTNIALAQKILERQIARAQTKIAYRQENAEDWNTGWNG